MTETYDFDHRVGKIAGAIYSDISHQFPHPPLMLVPALTFKVRKVMEHLADPNALSENQKKELAKDIRISIIPMLYSYEIEPGIIEQLTPIIESAARKGLA